MQLTEALLDSVSGIHGTVEGVMVGLNWTCVESSYVGMAQTLRGREDVELEGAGLILGCEARVIAARLRSFELLDASLGLAALCSLVEAKGDNMNAVNYILDQAPGKTVTCVGRFPFFKEIENKAARAYQLEMPHHERQFPPLAVEEVLPQSDLVILSATALIYKSLQRLLDLSRNAVSVVMGTSTPMSEVLFDFGADVLAGVRVVNSDCLYLSVAQGVKHHQKIAGIEPVTRFRK